MLRDAIEYLTELGAKQSSHQIVDDTRSHRTVMVRDESGVNFRDFKKDVPELRCTVNTIGSLRAAIDRFAVDDVCIWVSPSRVIAHLTEDADPYTVNLVVMPLSFNPIVESILNFESTDRVRKFVRFLNVTCGLADINPPDLAEQAGDIRFAMEESRHETVAKRQDTLSNDVRASVSGTENLPDTCSFTFNPYPALRGSFTGEVTLECQLDVDPVERRIAMMPSPGSLELAQGEATELLAEHISNLFAGSAIKAMVISGDPGFLPPTVRSNKGGWEHQLSRYV